MTYNQTCCKQKGVPERCMGLCIDPKFGINPEFQERNLPSNICEQYKYNIRPGGSRGPSPHTELHRLCPSWTESFVWNRSELYSRSDQIRSDQIIIRMKICSFTRVTVPSLSLAEADQKKIINLIIDCVRSRWKSWTWSACHCAKDNDNDPQHVHLFLLLVLR